MLRLHRASAVILLSLVAAAAGAQPRPRAIPGMTPSGPVVQSTGQTVKVDNATFVIPDGHVFKALYEINEGDTTASNQQLTTIARYLNLHARHGIPKERVHAAAVFHGSGWMAILSDSAYGARFGGKPNPSKRLVEELLANNVQLVLCGQTAGFRGVKREELLPGVQLAISAMTAFNVFQAQGYQFNPW
ncbi:MAG: DsrE family protein [Gemmatimonadetes bacterium]|nr:DsrE family protein [Gemmatimonadota bacterium]